MQRHVLRRAGSVFAAVLLIPAMAASARAASPPANDTPAGATVITTLPTTINEDTTAATTDATDSALNANCGAPATNASVWFTYTAPADGALVADMSASDHSGGLIITDGDPSLLDMLTCGPVSVGVSTQAGHTYFIVAFSDTPGVQGGNLSVTFDVGPMASLTVNPRGTAFKDGTARVSGTYTCSNANPDFSDVEGTLVQRVGRGNVSGFFFDTPLTCDGSTQTWSAIVFPDNGSRFAGGKAASVTLVFACSTAGSFCVVPSVEQKVMLTRAGR